jgi:branched-chain amino acid aminotransferase
VTRELLLEEIHVPGVKVVEKTMFPADLEAANEVFITSTTRNLLPVFAIEQLRLHHEGTARETLEAAFGQYLDRYVAEAKSRPELGVPR